MSNKEQRRLSEEHDDDDSVDDKDEFHNDLPITHMSRRKNKRGHVTSVTSSPVLDARRRYSKTPLIALCIVGIFVIAAVIRGTSRNNSNQPQPQQQQHTNMNNIGALRTQPKEHHYTNPYEKSASGDGKEHAVKVINEKSSTGHIKSHGGWNEDEQDETDQEKDWSCRTDFPNEDAWTLWMNHISRLGPQSACVRELQHRPCHCRHPLDPIARASTLWKQCLQHNQDLISKEQEVTSSSGNSNNNPQQENEQEQQREQPQQQLDVLMLGDSITEFWQGTKMGMTMPSLQATHQIYLDLFRNHHNNNNAVNNNNEYINRDTAPIRGLALGIAGDTCPQLLYRLQHNNELMLQHSSSSSPPPPKVYWILIGINDYLSNACNAHVIAACNIKIIEYIQQQYQQHYQQQHGGNNSGIGHSNNATIVINSMLPLGRHRSHSAFHEVSQINQQLECYAEHHDNVYFFNAYEDFMTTTSTTTSVTTSVTTSTIINASLLQDDGVHPSTLGYQVWGNAIVEYIQELKRLKKIDP
jgi:lysophospholipase L1-like esterase